MTEASNQKRMRVAFVITELEVGGAERCLVEIAARIDRQRFEPAVFALAARPSSGKDALVARLEEQAIPIQFLNARGARDFLSTVRSLRKHLSNWKPEVVQTFLFHANILGSIAARAASIHRIVTGARVADPSASRLRWEWAVSRWARRIVCVSHSVADLYQRRGFPQSKLVVIPNGVDLSRFCSLTPANLTPHGIPSGAPVLLCVGRLHAQKGFDWLLHLAADLLSTLPEHHLLIVGDGPERDALHRQAAALPVAARVHFAGWLNDVPSLLAASDLLLLPSRWEGMPNVLLEAMAVGRPVVATAVEGVTEVLGPSADEQSVPADDAQGFMKRVTRIAADPELARRLAQQNHARIDKEFSLDVMVQRYERLYEELCLKRREPSECEG